MLRVLLLIIFSLPLSAKAAFYSQAYFGGASGKSINTTYRFTGNHLGALIGVRVGNIAFEGAFNEKEMSLDSGQSFGNLSKADYSQQDVTLGVRYFIGRFISVATGIIGSSTELTYNAGTAEDIVSDLPSRSGTYVEAGLRLSVKKGAVFINYRKESYDDIEDTTIPESAKVHSYDAIIVGLSFTFDPFQFLK